MIVISSPGNKSDIDTTQSTDTWSCSCVQAIHEWHGNYQYRCVILEFHRHKSQAIIYRSAIVDSPMEAMQKRMKSEYTNNIILFYKQME